eukprot:616968_1
MTDMHDILHEITSCPQFYLASRGISSFSQYLIRFSLCLICRLVSFLYNEPFRFFLLSHPMHIHHGDPFNILFRYRLSVQEVVCVCSLRLCVHKKHNIKQSKSNTI